MEVFGNRTDSVIFLTAHVCLITDYFRENISYRMVLVMLSFIVIAFFEFWLLFSFYRVLDASLDCPTCL